MGQVGYRNELASKPLDWLMKAIKSKPHRFIDNNREKKKGERKAQYLSVYIENAAGADLLLLLRALHRRSIYS